MVNASVVQSPFGSVFLWTPGCLLDAFESETTLAMTGVPALVLWGTAEVTGVAPVERVTSQDSRLKKVKHLWFNTPSQWQNLQSEPKMEKIKAVWEKQTDPNIQVNIKENILCVAWDWLVALTTAPVTPCRLQKNIRHRRLQKCLISPSHFSVSVVFLACLHMEHFISCQNCETGTLNVTFFRSHIVCIMTKSNVAEKCNLVCVITVCVIQWDSTLHHTGAVAYMFRGWAACTRMILH